MRRTYAAILLATAIALPLGACGDDSSGGYPYAVEYGCEHYATCGTCTPVLGCGWCFRGTSGVCTSDPDRCAQVVSEFTWTWDPSGCPDVDAGVAPIDASPVPADTGTTQADTGSPQIDSAPPPQDAGTPQVDAGAPQVDAGVPPSDAAGPSSDASAE
jgi:hypothetical protein